MSRKIDTARTLLAAVLSAALIVLTPPSALSQLTGGEALTKGAFIQRFFLNKFTRPPAARAYVPEGVERLAPAERYAAVVKRLNERGVLSLVGSRPEEPLTRVEYITLTYLLAGGPIGVSFAAQKAFLKARGVLKEDDIGYVKAYQGDVTITRARTEKKLKMTGAEPVLFRDLDETDFGARVELQLDDGSTLIIGEDTALRIDEMVYDPKTKRRSISLRLTVGLLRVNAAENKNPDSKFEVITPTTVAGVRGTLFTLQVAASGLTRLITTRGLVGLRAALATERRPPPREGKLPPAPKTKPKEVLVGAGKTAEVLPGAVKIEVKTATKQQMQKAEKATKITKPAKVKAVTKEETKRTDKVVKVEVLKSATGSVRTRKETSKTTRSKGVKDDKGEATEEVIEEGGSTLTTTNTPTTPTSTTEKLGALTGARLKEFFLGLSDGLQAEEFGKLTKSQQFDLVGRLALAEAVALLARFRPGSPFRATVLDSLRDFWRALEGQTTRTLLAQLFGKLTAAQAEGLLPDRPAGEIVGFFDGLTASAQAAVLDDLSASQAGTILPSRAGTALRTFFKGLKAAVRTALIGKLTPTQAETVTPDQPASGVAAFFHALTASAQAAVLDDFATAQATELLKGRSGAPLKTVFLGLRDAVQADTYGTMNKTQQTDLNGRLNQTDTEALLARMGPTGPFSAAVKDSLLDLVAAATATQIGQSLDNITPDQAKVIDGCDELTRDCGPELFVGKPKDATIEDLTPFGLQVEAALEKELDRLARLPGTGLVNGKQMLLTSATGAAAPADQNTAAAAVGTANREEVAFEILDILDGGRGPQMGTRDLTDAEIADIFGGAMRPSQYFVNGGFQAAQLRSGATGGSGTGTIAGTGDMPARIAVLEGNGFLSYASQVEEDLVNTAAEVIKGLPSGITPAFVGDGMRNLSLLVEDNIDMSQIRERDGRLAVESDARAGLVTFNSQGQRVRVQQYVFRPVPDQVRTVSISLTEPGHLSYIDLRTEFQANQLAGKSSLQIRNLPWNDYFTVLYNGDPSTCAASGCMAMVSSPVGTPLLAHLRVEMGNQNGEFLREELLGFTGRFDSTFGESGFSFAGALVKANLAHQHPSQIKLTVGTTGQTPQVFKVGNNITLSDPNTFGTFLYDPRAGSTLSTNPIPLSEFRSIPSAFIPGGITPNPGDPQGFLYVANSGGSTTKAIDVLFSVLGDSTSLANTGVQTATCGPAGTAKCDTLKFDTIWDAFRVNEPDGSGLGNAINIGANVLQIEISTSSQSLVTFSAPIRNVFIPYPRMIWKGESGFTS